MHAGAEGLGQELGRGGRDMGAGGRNRHHQNWVCMICLCGR